MTSILKKCRYLHNERVFCYNVLSFFIILQDLSFGGFALKIELVVFVYELFIYEIVFVYELFIYEIIFLLLGYVITSTSDIQPSTAIANQLTDQLVSTKLEAHRDMAL